MKNWLKALFSQWFTSALSVISILSTLTTFFFPGLAIQLRLVLAISAIFGFAWANFIVFQKQQSRISTLQSALTAHEARTPELIITPDGRSKYVLQPLGNTRRADFAGGHFEFHLMIENRGRRNSIVNNYRVEIVELHRTFPDLESREGRNGVQGRHCHMGLNPQSVLSRNGIIQIEAEAAIGCGTLLFFLPDINMDEFVAAGLHMEEQERKFGTLTCRLTLTDTTQSSASCEFQLTEE